jgi:hypothetical protein
VRSGDSKYAIIISQSRGARRRISTSLEALGWSIMGEGTTARSAIEAAGIVPGIDLVVVDAMSAVEAQNVATELSILPQTTVTPVLLLAGGVEAQILREATDGQDMVAAGDSAISDIALAAVLEDLLSKAAGGSLDFDEAEMFAGRALSILRDIALANTVLDVGDATGALVDALTIANPSMQALVAETLSMIDSPVAQRALVSAALLDAPIEDQMMLLNEASASVRRWGNLSKDWQVVEIETLAKTTSGALADAAARLNGAINNPSASVMIFMPDQN